MSSPIVAKVVVVDHDELANYNELNALYVFDSLEEARNALSHWSEPHHSVDCWTIDNNWEASDHFDSIESFLDALGDDRYPTMDEEPKCIGTDYDSYVIIDAFDEVASEWFSRLNDAKDHAERIAAEAPGELVTVCGVTALASVTAEVFWKDVYHD